RDWVITRASHSLFQSALPRGERHEQHASYIQGWLFQSALPRGERHCPVQCRDRALVFQSALPRGERPRWWHPGWVTKSFQSALPRGERRTWSARHSALKRFNPRSRVGSDEEGRQTKTQLS